MRNYKELEEALSLVKNLCTVEQIQDLLRTRKGEDNVRITAENKDAVVDRNLREAVEAGAIDVSNVFDLIRSSEENGYQHVFYYKPKSKQIADALTFESVAQQLWGKNWKQTIDDFPAIKLKPNDYQFSDFRPHPKKPKDWILKIYGHALITRFTGKTEVRSDHSIWRQYVEESLRIVLLARWNNQGLLEVRVQRNESRKRVEEWHNKVWEMLKPALVRAQFDPWGLSKSISLLIERQIKNEKVYDFRDASVVDPFGIHVSFQAFSDQGNLFASLETRDSLQRYMEADGKCNGLTVTWRKQADRSPQKDMRTLLAAKEENEIIVFAHCAGEDLDYVADQLRQLNK